MPGPTVIFTGMVAADPGFGGLAWAVLNHLLGLQALGCDVHLVEPVTAAAIQPAGAPLGASDNAAYLRAALGPYGLSDCATLLQPDTKETAGASYGELTELAARADLLVNVAGMLSDPELTEPVGLRVYLDLDPGFTQLWQAEERIDMRLQGHTHFVTVGPSLGTPGCPIPTLGHEWFGILPPVALNHWPLAGAVTHDAFTTVANWRGYGSLTYRGVHYGQKAHAARPLLALPGRTGDRFLLALGIHPDERPDIEALDAHGWERANPATVASTPERYRRFVQRSAAELGIAKSGYVAGRTGWFSDRSACYLASGRPVLAQDTGFGHHLPVGEGLLRFTDLAEAADGVRSIRVDYPRHAKAARAVAEEHLDARKVLDRLLRHVGCR